MIDLTNIPGDNFCIAPWTNLHISPEGKFKPCCGGDGWFGNINDNDWSYIDGTNQEATQLKQSLLNNEKVDFCGKCQEKGWYSQFKNFDLKIEKTEDFKLKSIDIRWGITCQLTCTYCDSANSSSWGQLSSRYYRVIPIKNFSYNDEKEKLFAFIEKHAHTLQRVNMVGGEPLLLKDNSSLLDILPPDVTIEVITNLDVDISKNEIYQKLISRDNVVWNLSMENVGERFEYVRRGANWDQHVKNMKQLEKDTASRSNIALKIHSLYHAYSALNLVELFDFCATQLTRFTINCESFVFNPSPLCFLDAPKSLKEESLRQIEYCYNSATGRFSHERGIWLWLRDRVIDSMDQVDPDFVQKCVEFNITQDQKYFGGRHDFLALWPIYTTKNTP